MPQNIFKIYDGRTNFWQWDKNQKLIVLDESITEVRFSNKNMTHSIPENVYTDRNGLRVCNVPDVLLTIPKNLLAYVCDDEVVVKTVKFAVVPQPIPSDYIADSSGELDEIVERIYADIGVNTNAIKVLNGDDSTKGSVANTINNAVNALDVVDTAVAGKYVSAVNEVDGKVVITRADLPDYTDTYSAKVHTHKIDDVNGLADSIAKAKDYADGLDEAMDGRVAALEAKVDTGAKKVSEYVDDAIKQIDQSADWNVNDENADGYVKNRTHYTVDRELLASFEMSVENVDTYSVNDADSSDVIRRFIDDGNKAVDVFIDGILYQCQAIFNNGHYYINLDGSTKTGQGLRIYAGGSKPYMIYLHPESFGLDMNAETRMVEVYTPEVVKKLDQKYIPYVRSDWNQNDETSPAYVKNRPFYSEIGTIAFVEQQEVTIGSDMYVALTASNMPFVAGDTYTVMFNGVRYECVAWNGNYGSVCIGNGSIYGNDGFGNDEPFLCEFYEYDGIYLNTYTEGTYTISILGVGETVYKIDEKYLPEMIGASGTSNNAEIFNDYENNVASGTGSHAEGSGTTASGAYSHAEGINTTASGDYSHAEGAFTISSGEYSHAEGNSAYATGKYSHAEGAATKAASEYQHVQGKYNIEDSSNTYAHIVGNGTGAADSKRSNAHTIDWSGNAWFAGDVKIGGNSYNDKEAKTLATTEYVDNTISASLNKLTKVQDITLLASNWVGNTNPWHQVVAVNGVTANSRVDLRATALQIVELQDNDIAFIAENDDGVITVYALGSKPDVDYTIQAEITEVVVV